MTCDCPNTTPVLMVTGFERHFEGSQFMPVGISYRIFFCSKCGKAFKNDLGIENVFVVQQQPPPQPAPPKRKRGRPRKERPAEAVTPQGDPFEHGAETREHAE